MVKAFKYFFGSWKRPIIFWGIVATAAIVLVVFQLLLQNELFYLFNILFILYLVSMYGLLFSAVCQLYDKNRKKALLNIRIFGGSIILFAFIIIAEFLIEQSTPNQFTNGLTIPQNIEVFEPKNELAELYGLIPDSKSAARSLT